MKSAVAVLSVVVFLCWPVSMSLAGFASRMAVSRELKSVLPNLYSASLVPITFGDKDELVTEATDPTTLQQVVIQQDTDISLAFVVRRAG